MTRADELLAELRGAMAVRDAPERLRSAVADMDAFMAVFGVLPKAWQVRLHDIEEPVSPGTRARAAAKLGVIVRDSMAEAGYHDQALAGAIARDVLEALLEESRETQRMARYWAVYGEREIAQRMAEPVVMHVDGDGTTRILRGEELAAFKAEPGSKLALGFDPAFPPPVLDPELLGDFEPCPYSFPHTRSWCGRNSCREA